MMTRAARHALATLFASALVLGTIGTGFVAVLSAVLSR